MKGLVGNRHQFFRQSQQGAALVVSLVLLAVITLLGVVSMQSSNSELKMTGTMRDRGVTFEAAEAALSIIEKDLKNNPPKLVNRLSDCTGTECFNPACTGGLCFEGEYLPTYSRFECEVVKFFDPVKERTNFWRDKDLNVWGNAARHKTLVVNNLDKPVKYIIEFLCYVPAGDGIPFSALPSERNLGVPLYRISVLAEGNGGRASVSLQSTYSVLNTN